MNFFTIYYGNLFLDAPVITETISPNSPVLFVYLVTKANSVHNCKLQMDVAFLQIVRSRSQIHAILVMARLFGLKRGVKECVH